MQTTEDSIENLWNESYRQIDPTLKAMEWDGLAESAEEEKAGRTVYSPAEDGGEPLREWSGLAPHRRAARNKLPLELFSPRWRRLSRCGATYSDRQDNRRLEVKKYTEVYKCGEKDSTFMTPI